MAAAVVYSGVCGLGLGGCLEHNGPRERPGMGGIKTGVDVGLGRSVRRSQVRKAEENEAAGQPLLLSFFWMTGSMNKK